MFCPGSIRRIGTALHCLLVVALSPILLAGCGSILSREPLVNRSLEPGVETLARVDGSSNTRGSVASPLVDGDARTAIWATEASVILPAPRRVGRIAVRAPDVVDMDLYIRESSDGRFRLARRFINFHGAVLRVKLPGSPTLDGVEIRVRRSTTHVVARREQWRDALGDAGHRSVRGRMRRENRPLPKPGQGNGWGVIEMEATTEEPVRPPVTYVRARIYEIELLGPAQAD